MSRDGLGTLKLERNAARAPIWAPRSGVPVQLALAWPELPFHGSTFAVSHLTGTLGPTELLVFTRLCSLYLARTPVDVRVRVSLGDVARWSGSATVGGSQRRLAVACLTRLRAATFTSRLRFGRKGSERFLRGWGLIDEWSMPTDGRHAGWVRLSPVMAELLDAGSVVFLDARLLDALVRRSGLAARLWVLLESDSLDGRLRTADGQPYRVFTARPGEPLPDEGRAGIADVCRLVDERRGRTVSRLRRACGTIEAVDERYRLLIRSAKKPREGMWNLIARRVKSPVTSRAGPGAPWGSDRGTLGPVTGAPWGMHGGTLGDAGAPDIVRDQGPSARVTGAPWGLDAGSPRRALLDGSLDGLETARSRTVDGSPSFTQADAIARDRSIIADLSSPTWKRDAARAHLRRLGVGEEVDDAG